tara:strand:+ start:306 stop:560 length:255 start_codon:yes stop_codon:yes gene_type:complete
MKKTTKVMNVLTEEIHTFYNGHDLETNLISAIIYSSEDRRKLLEYKYRTKITNEAKVEYINSKNGSVKVYSPSYDMIAYLDNQN